MSTGHSVFTSPLSLPLLSLLLVPVVLCDSNWDYNDNGRSWVSQFPQFCSGRRQSPIDLGVGESQVDDRIQEFVFKENVTDTEVELTVKNDGHKLLLSWHSSKSISIGIKDSDMTYTAAQLHWHWGSDETKGSEHTVEGKSYPAEGHLVFYNSKDYANFEEAAAAVNGLAVIGVFYELHSNGNPMLRELESAIGRVNASDSSHTFTHNAFNLVNSLLPTSRSEFYRYDGSLTTPECNENVLWTVYTQPVPIGLDQLRMLRRLRYANGNSMSDNYRITSQLNPTDAVRPGSPRILFRTFNSASGNKLSAFGLVLCFVASLATAKTVGY